MKLYKSLKLSKFLTLRNPLGISKKAQLGIIEAKFWFIGFIIGIIAGLALALLSCATDILPKVGFLCG